MSKPKPSGQSLPCCPICKKPQTAAYRPFCSKRCADIDLGNWFGEGYRIPSKEEGDEDWSGEPGPTSEGSSTMH